MCGIFCVIGADGDIHLMKKLSKRMSHRGPDESDIITTPKGHILSHERLSIIDLTTGRQPIKGTSTAWMVHNGEIYNHAELRKTTLKHHKFITTSDSEVIVHLYEEFKYDFLDMLDGVFAFVVVDGDDFIAARDPIGVKPLYYGRDAKGRIYFSSEMKVLVDQCTKFKASPPGHYFTPKTGFVRYFQPKWITTPATREWKKETLRKALIKATKKRLMSDVPLGVLLSGGLDSSLTSSIAAKILKKEGRSLHSFSVGIDKSAPDLIAARKVADFIGTIHHEIFFSVDQGIKAIDKLIWHLETYDITSIRASTPMYFLSKYISDYGIKVVLSGEGADEILGGYLYFKNTPSTPEFQRETVSRVLKLSTADCLRADKSTMAHSIEARVPFLDKEFLEVSMAIETKEKLPRSYKGIEKYILRSSFDCEDDPYLPQEILWRQKEQFSDGVGYSWIDQLIAYAENHVSDEEFSQASCLFPINTPTTKEAFFYRSIFYKHFPQDEAARTVLKWIPKWQDSSDPSGRANKSHVCGDLA